MCVILVKFLKTTILSKIHIKTSMFLVVLINSPFCILLVTTCLMLWIMKDNEECIKEYKYNT